MELKQGGFQRVLVLLLFTAFSFGAFSQIFSHPSAKPAEHNHKSSNCYSCTGSEETGHSRPSSHCSCYEQDRQNLIAQEPATFTEDQLALFFQAPSRMALPEGALSVPTKPPTQELA